MKIVRWIIAVLIIMATGYFAYLLMATENAESVLVKSYLLDFGTAETGAQNLVTAIYLGYRAFDTLGETIVLVLAVVGVSLLFVRKS